MTPYILCLFSDWIISTVIRCWVLWVPCIFWILLSYLLYCKYCLPFCRMSFHFVDCFFPWAEAFMFGMVSLVDYCFCWLCFWYCIQNFTARVPVEKLIPYVFCRLGSPLSHALLQARTRSAKVWALVAVSPASFLSVWPPVFRPVRWGLSGPPGKLPETVGKRDVRLGFSLLHWRSHGCGGGGVLSQCGPVPAWGWALRSKGSCSSSPAKCPSGSLLSRGCFSLPLGFWDVPNGAVLAFV